jgi:hypothetical protein
VLGLSLGELLGLALGDELGLSLGPVLGEELGDELGFVLGHAITPLGGALGAHLSALLQRSSNSRATTSSNT